MQNLVFRRDSFTLMLTLVENCSALVSYRPLFLFQEELKILRLMVSVLSEGELETQEAELTRRMNETKDRKTQTAGALAEAKREVEQFRESYEIVLAEDKALDKAFKKDFGDQDLHTVEQLYKLFKRRPR